ncbi:MAG: dihydrodipicolinate synthase family protein [Acidobacteria bacterium]|nr:dihydrodipicolinate synthase family protein [Acidobacteriota bacterium]
MESSEQDWLALLRRGAVIPAHPLALTADRKLDERRQRALTRYYLAAGAGGVAIGVHTTQFAIRDSKFGLYRPVLELGAEETRDTAAIRVAGVIGPTLQATTEAALARDLGYHAVLLSLAALREASVDQLIDHVRAVAEIAPVFGFYLQPAVGGRLLPYSFWRRFAEIENVVAIKIAPFNRYQTIDVVRAVAESGRDIALYTGNDDNIVADLVAEHHFGGRCVRIVGGLLGHWAAWTHSAVDLLDRAHDTYHQPLDPSWLRLAIEVTDSNAALFDAANQFHGCIAGIHEILRRQGLLEGRWCLDPNEDLSPGQLEEIDRVCQAYPHLADDAFVLEHRDQWLR